MLGPDAFAGVFKVLNHTGLCEIPNSPDTLHMSLTGFASVACCTALESTVLGLPDFARS